uniref:Phosducin domain-containing protein n=1 Tax=Phlebotomus papatasi TaxID=29031 RepID=A0A1B0DKR7_PHLPP
AAAAVGKDIEKPQAEVASVHRIRITLTSRNVRSLEKVCADLVTGAKKQKLRVKNTVPACRRLNECLEELAKEMPTIKFCRILSSDAKVSLKFRSTALPTILAYKKNQIIGNFVQLGNELGDDFCSSDIENFLIEQGVIVEKEIQYNSLSVK